MFDAPTSVGGIIFWREGGRSSPRTLKTLQVPELELKVHIACKLSSLMSGARTVCTAGFAGGTVSETRFQPAESLITCCAAVAGRAMASKHKWIATTTNIRVN